jgi:hypothetical protein
MTRFITLKLEDAEKELIKVKVEPIIHDNKLIAIKIGNLRIWGHSKDLNISQELSDD